MLSYVFFVCAGLAFLMLLELDIAADSILFQMYQVLFAAIAAVGGYRLQDIPEGPLVLFQNRN